MYPVANSEVDEGYGYKNQRLITGAGFLVNISSVFWYVSRTIEYKNCRSMIILMNKIRSNEGAESQLLVNAQRHT